MGKLTRVQFRQSIEGILSHWEAPGLSKKVPEFWDFFSRYLPHYAKEETPEFHREIISLLESGEKFCAIGAPRGFAKSTLISFAYVIWKILSGERRFIVIVSATDKLAADLAECIRLEFQDNPRILQDFGQLPVDSGRRGDFTVRKTRILALGRRRALRGFRFRQHRPDLVILDDIEKDGEVFNPEVVDKTLDVILRGLIPSLEPERGRLILVGTILQARSAAGKILTSSEEPFCLWARAVYRALNGEESLWQARFPAEGLRQLRAQMGEAAFNGEYQNLPHSERSLFQPRWFAEAEDEPEAPIAVFIDPSPDGIKRNDYKAAIFLARSRDKFVIAHGVFVQGGDQEFFPRLAEAYLRFRRRIIAVVGEGNGFQGYFLKDLREYFAARGLILPLRSHKNLKNKGARIARLAGYFETGTLVFASGTLSTGWGRILREQLEGFPSSSVHDDGPDALAGALSALEQETPPRITVLPRAGKRGF